MIKKIIRWLDKAWFIFGVPFFVWTVLAQILIHFFGMSVDSIMNNWFGDIGTFLIICIAITGFPCFILRAIAYEDKTSK
jgi:hypothetical protein